PLPSSPCPRLYAPPTFPTRRSSDLDLRQRAGERIVDIDIDDRSSAVLGFMQRVDDISLGARGMALVDAAAGDLAGIAVLIGLDVDRKSTRLNSSHVKISYAVFCLKK